MTDILERLNNWEKVYSEDAYKIEGHLYAEAADEIERLREREQEFIRSLQAEANLHNQSKAEIERLREEVKVLEAALDNMLYWADELSQQVEASDPAAFREDYNTAAELIDKEEKHHAKD